MKRTRNLLIAAAVLAVLCAVIFAEGKISRHVDRIRSTEETVFSAVPDELLGIRWEYNGASLYFRRDGSRWVYDADSDFPVDQQAIADFVEHFTDVKADFRIDDAADLAQYELEEPQCVVTFTTESGDTVMNLGGYSVMDAKRYATMNDDTVYLLQSDLLQHVTTDRDAFMHRDSLPKYDDFVSLSVSGDVTGNIVYDEDGVYAYTDSYHYYEISDGYRYLSDSSVVNFLNILNGLTPNDYVTYTASAEDLAEYGLAEPALILELTGTAAPEMEGEADEQVAFRVSIGRVQIPSEAEEDEEAEPEYDYYYRLDDSSIIYRLDGTTYKALNKCGYDDLRPVQVLSPDWNSLKTLSMTIGEETYSIEAVWRSQLEQDDASDEEQAAQDEEDEDDELVYLLDGQQVDITTLKAKADNLSINTFLKESAEAPLELAMELTLEREQYSEVSIAIYRYDGDNCLLYLDGEPMGLITRTMMVNLREAMTSIVLNLAADKAD